MIAKVVLDSFSKATSGFYHYVVPDFLTGAINVGMRVKVPFGRGNKTFEGYVIGFTDRSEFSNLKEIISADDTYLQRRTGMDHGNRYV